MRTLGVICIAATQFTSVGALAQTSGTCTPMLSYVHRASLAGEASAFSVSADLRRQAGFSPAIVVAISVAPAAATAQFVDKLEAKSSTSTQALKLRRAEFWVLGSAPRKATALEGMPTLSARDLTAYTLYRLFYSVPEGVPEEFTLVDLAPVLEGHAVNVPPLRFIRVAGPVGLTLCSTQ